MVVNDIQFDWQIDFHIGVRMPSQSGFLCVQLEGCRYCGQPSHKASIWLN